MAVPRPQGPDQRELKGHLRRDDIRGVEEQKVLRKQRPSDRGEKGARAHSAGARSSGLTPTALPRLRHRGWRQHNSHSASPRWSSSRVYADHIAQHQNRVCRFRCKHHVYDAWRRKDHQAFGATRDVGPVQGTNPHHLRSGQSRENKERSAKTRADQRENAAKHRRANRAYPHADPGRQTDFVRKNTGCVSAYPEKRGMTEGYQPRVSPRDVPLTAQGRPTETTAGSHPAYVVMGRSRRARCRRSTAPVRK